MIRGIIFDLDGTLVQTEKLKAQSYAVAVQRLRGLPEPDSQAIEAYRSTVGVSRNEASRFVADRLGLEAELRPLMEEYKVDEPSLVLSAMRKAIYEEMVSDPQVIRDNQWPHTVGLLRVSRETFCRTALATMSYRPEALHVLRALDLEKELDVVVTQEDVQRGKPAPDIYLLAARKLGVPPEECLVLEDTPNGVRAAVAAGTNVVALATPFTYAGLHSDELEGLLEHSWIVHDQDELLNVVRRRIEDHSRAPHPIAQDVESEALGGI